MSRNQRIGLEGGSEEEARPPVESPIVRGRRFAFGISAGAETAWARVEEGGVGGGVGGGQCQIEGSHEKPSLSCLFLSSVISHLIKNFISS